MAYIPRSELTPKELAEKRAKGRARYRAQKAKKLTKVDPVITLKIDVPASKMQKFLQVWTTAIMEMK